MPVNSAPRPAYLDYQATTPCDPRVVEAMLPWFTEKFGNPHSREHAYGWEAEDAVDRARTQIADLIGAQAREVVFTSGATESNNLAIKGAMRFHGPRRGHMIALATEHKCVLESAAAAERMGYEVTILAVCPDGMIDMDDFRAHLRDRTALVSVMSARGTARDLSGKSRITSSLELCYSEGRRISRE